MATICDTFNGSTNPKAIPGAYVRYSVTISNPATSGSVVLTSVTDTLPSLLTFDTNFLKSTGIAGSPTGGACAAIPANLEPGGALGNGFRMMCSIPTTNKRACATAPTGTFYTSAADADPMGISGAAITMNFSIALPAESVGTTYWAVGELKAGEAVTVHFNAVIK